MVADVTRNRGPRAPLLVLRSGIKEDRVTYGRVTGAWTRLALRGQPELRTARGASHDTIMETNHPEVTRHVAGFVRRTTGVDLTAV
jgi:hypothetical protein